MFVIPAVVTVGLLVMSLVEAYWILPTHPGAAPAAGAAALAVAAVVMTLPPCASASLCACPGGGDAPPPPPSRSWCWMMRVPAAAVATGLVRVQFFAFDSMRLFYVNVIYACRCRAPAHAGQTERAVKVLGETIGADESRAVAV